MQLSRTSQTFLSKLSKKFISNLSRFCVWQNLFASISQKMRNWLFKVLKKIQILELFLQTKEMQLFYEIQRTIIPKLTLLSKTDFTLLLFETQFRRLNEKLLHWSNLPQFQKKSLIPKVSHPPRVYGLPKIHKCDASLRPIVDLIGSSKYDDAKYLAKLLTFH